MLIEKPPVLVLVPMASLPATERLLADRPSHIIEHDVAPVPPDNPWGFVIKPPPHKANLGEIYNLSIRRGTLTEEERYHINDHIVQTIIMLEALPYPKHLRRVPEWAGGHHEKMDGRGYPRKVTGDAIPIQTRMMTISDIYDALTAQDRPYKRAVPRDRALDILTQEVKAGQLDTELFRLFIAAKVFEAAP